MERYRRTRPRVSFALATAMLFVLALALTGVLQFTVDLSVLDTNPQMVAVGLVFAVIAALLLYEW
jgi:hypothetical protein